MFTQDFSAKLLQNRRLPQAISKVAGGGAGRVNVALLKARNPQCATALASQGRGGHRQPAIRPAPVPPQPTGL